MLQYADDTIFLLENELSNARNLKNILCVFEQLSGLNINFHKSEIFCLGDGRNSLNDYMEFFTCEDGFLPMLYLGMPVDAKRLRNSQWIPTAEKIDKKMSS